MSDDGSMVSARVLLVEDHEPFRGFVRAKLQEQRDLLLIAETGNGLDAVARCVELQPNLVLMDIGLPGLNGLEAARRIRALVPACKIIFLTQESSAEIVQEALKLGASGYVIKAHAANDLRPALDAAVEGRQFVSSVVAPFPGVGGADAEASNSVHETLPHKPGPANSHSVHFYSDETSLLAGFTGFIHDTLKSGKAVIAIVTEPHRKQIFQSLHEHDLDVAAAMDAGRFVSVDVGETLASFMVDDLPDPERFFRFAGDLVKKVKAMNHDARVLACGEMSPTLWSWGNERAAVQVEHLASQLVRMYNVETFCAYAVTSSQRKSETYEAICAAHTSVHSF